MNLQASAIEDLYLNSIHPDYSDDDIMILDNIKEITDPNPLRLSMNGIVVCIQGRVQGSLNGTSIEVKAKDVLLIPPNTYIDDVMISPDFECKAIFLTNKAIRCFLGNYSDVWNKALYLDRLRVRVLNDAEKEFLSKYYDLLRMCIDRIKKNGKDYVYGKEVVRSIVRGGLLFFCGELVNESFKKPVRTSNDDIFLRFLDLLQNSPQKHMSVASYAEKLCITPKYLTVICKQNSGKTAMAWILEYTLADIVFYLRDTKLSMKEIADKTGFPNSSFFGKFVKTHLGKPPLDYRHSINGNG